MGLVWRSWIVFRSFSRLRDVATVTILTLFLHLASNEDQFDFSDNAIRDRMAMNSSLEDLHVLKPT